MKAQALWLSAGLMAVLALAGCAAPGGDVLNQKAVAELNTKAQRLMQTGDTTGAIARLESAHDLAPEEPTTIYNLAIAYQAAGNYAKSLEYLQLLQGKPGIDAAEIQKTMGINYEALGDQLNAPAEEGDSKVKPDPAAAADRKHQAEEAYQKAIAAYRQAIASGAKNPGALEKQITALEARHETPRATTP